MKIRQAKIEDAETLITLVKSLFISEKNFDKDLKPSDNWLKAYVEHSITNSLFLVAEDDEQLIGLLLSVATKSPIYPFETAQIKYIYVEKTHQNLGIGTKLFKKCKNFYNKKGINKIFVSHYAENEQAKAFYKKLGFNEYTTTYFIS